MREFMTKLRDRLSERWNDPERREDRLAVVIVGVAAAVVIVALLIVLWGYLARGRGHDAGDTVSGNTLQAVAYEEKMREYMAQNEGQAALWREYAARVERLSSEVERLLEAMTKTRQELSETIERYRDGDALVQRELTAFLVQVDSVVQKLGETQTQLYDLTDLVQVMSEETLPLIREQLAQLEGDMERAQTDIVDLYTRIAALEQEDSELWESIEDIRDALGNVESVIVDALKQEDGKLWESLVNVRNVLESVESGVGEMRAQILRYRYDEESRTLYLDPYQD